MALPTNHHGHHVYKYNIGVKLQFLGNNSKTVNKNRNLTGVKMISTARSTYPAILK
jgi:hypothetical protein